MWHPFILTSKNVIPPLLAKYYAGNFHTILELMEQTMQSVPGLTWQDDSTVKTSVPG